MSALGNLALDQRPAPLPAQMRAAILSDAGRFVVGRVAVPKPAASELLVQVEGCGICGSSLPVWEGRPWFEYPRGAGIPGHEGWGTIASVGTDVRGLEAGQRVTFLSDSAFAEFAAVPAQNVVQLPEELDEIPFPGEAIGCAMNIFRRAEIAPGQVVAVVGAGFLGLLLVQLAAAAGARVFAFSRRRFARELALSSGAEDVFDTTDWRVSAHDLLTHLGRGCDRVVEATGLQFALDLATELVAEYGKIVVAGYHQDGPRQVNMQQWNWRAIDVINAHERDPRRYVQGIREAVTATVSGRIRPAALLTHEVSLDELNAGFRLMQERPDGFVKGWVRP